jgi:hypothetical protein
VSGAVTDERVSIRAHYERVPASVKGAFVLRGGDRDPHQVRIDAARTIELSGRVSLPMNVEAVTVNVIPHQDLFVPFEVPVLELEAGWYALECDVAVDGDEGTIRPGDPFHVAWPRGALRRGTVAVGRRLGEAKIEQVECAGDSVRVSYGSSEPVDLSLELDGAALTVLDRTFDAEAGTGRVRAYPAPRSAARLAIADPSGSSVEIALP